MDVPKGGGVQRSGCHTGLNVLPQSRLDVSDGCAGLQLFSFLSGWSPHA